MDADTLYAKARHYNRLPKERTDTASKDAFVPYPSVRAWAMAMRESGLTLGQLIGIALFNDPAADVREVSIGFHGERSCLHFVGFRGEEYWSAVKVWGTPHFVHPQADFRMIGEMGPEDVVIYGPKAFNVPRKWRQQAH